MKGSTKSKGGLKLWTASTNSSDLLCYCNSSKYSR